MHVSQEDDSTFELHFSANDAEAKQLAPLFSLFVNSTRIGVTFGITATILTAFLLFVYGSLVVVDELWKTVTDGMPNVDGAKHLSVIAVEITDLFLLGTVLNIVALGLFQLFIDPSLSQRLPVWLRVKSLDQLKSKLVGVIAVLLGVSFMAEVVEWDGSNNVLYLGLSIATVIVALGLLSSVLDRSETKK